MDIATILQTHSRPLAPLPVEVAPSLPGPMDLQAVLWDIYGTLLISGSGDVGSADPKLRSRAVLEALQAVGFRWAGDPERPAAALQAAIVASHASSRAAGIEYPEVDIRAIWEEVLEELYGPPAGREIDPARLAVEYEVRANPVWPMPGATACLANLVSQGLILGIISNAQFFTPHLFPALCGKSVAALGFAPGLRYYSYESGRAKPDPSLFRAARTALEGVGISASATLFVGNDMRNDIWPASAAGFRTALFAGDARSLRWRRDDSPGDGWVAPDAVVTSLSQIPALISLPSQAALRSRQP